MVTFGIFDSTILIKFLYPKRGGGWRKTFKISPWKSWVRIENLAPHLYLTSKNILRAFQINRFHSGFNPDPE